MSSNSQKERKCTGQNFTLEDNLNRSELEPLDRAGHKKEAKSGNANAEAERWARLVDLRAAIKTGSYRVGALDLAEAIFRFAERHHTAARQMYSA